MASKPVSQQFADDISDVIDKYREEGITISEIIGGLELNKMDIWNEQQEDDLL